MPESQTTATFPVLSGLRLEEKGKFSVPWDLIEPHRRQAMRNHGQTLERLAERGGLSWSELLAVLNDRPWRSIAADQAQLQVSNIVHLHVRNRDR